MITAGRVRADLLRRGCSVICGSTEPVIAYRGAAMIAVYLKDDFDDIRPVERGATPLRAAEQGDGRRIRIAYTLWGEPFDPGPIIEKQPAWSTV